MNIPLLLPHLLAAYRGRKKRVYNPTLGSQILPEGNPFTTGDLGSVTAEALIILSDVATSVLDSPLNMTHDREFAELAILSITGPHSYIVFEVFELSDLLFYFPDKAGYFD